MDNNMTILKRIAKLLDVKSIMTLALTGCFVFLAVIGKISGEQFLGIFTMITGFYFGTQAMKQSQQYTQTASPEGTETKGE